MRRSIPLLVATVFAGVATPTRGQETKPSVDVEAGAVAALERMGTYLRSLKAFRVVAQYSTEEVLDNGVKVTFGGKADLLASRPNRLRVEAVSEQQERLYLYDGQSFTLFAPGPGYFTTVPAPASIGELADVVEDKYDLELPLVDLFRWGGPRSTASSITFATDIGPGAVGDTTCEHYAFRQPGLDWQVWIQLGDYPLPRKIILTTTTDEARPGHTVAYDWDLAPSFNDDAFKFDPPAGARKIAFVEGKR